MDIGYFLRGNHNFLSYQQTVYRTSEVEDESVSEKKKPRREPTWVGDKDPLPLARDGKYKTHIVKNITDPNDPRLTSGQREIAKMALKGRNPFRYIPRNVKPISDETIRRFELQKYRHKNGKGD